MFQKYSRITSFVVTVLVVVALSLSVVSANEYDQKQMDSNLNATATADHIALSWSADPLTTMTITWRTDTTVDTCQVEYKEAGTSDSVIISVKGQLFKTSDKDPLSGEMNLFTTTLKGLKPGAKYIYRIGNSRNQWSKYYTFKTEAQDTITNNKFKFIVFGDSQSGNPSVPDYNPWHVTVENAYKANQDAHFFMNMGDLVEKGQSYQHWNNWYSAAQGVISNIPDMVVQGNHETYNGIDGNSTKPEYFTKQFNIFQNGPADFKGQTYSFNYGKVHFVILDSQGSEESQDDTGKVNLDKEKEMFNEQAEWLAKDLEANRNATYTFVFFHKTPYYNKGNRTNVLLKNTFCPIFDKYHVDVVFNGHDHATSRTFPIFNDQLMQSPQQGTVYYVTGRSGAKYYPDLTQKVWDAKFFDPQDQPDYQTVELNGKKVTIRAFKQDGTLVDTYVIDKEHPENNTSNSDMLPPRYNTKQENPVLGDSVKLVLFGNMANGSSAKATIVNGKAYADIGTIAAYAEGSYDATTKTLIVRGQKFVLSEDMLVDKGTKVSIDALNSMGWNNHYDAKFNMVFIEI